MQVFTTIAEFRAARRELSPTSSLGLVPTMGYLHDGHLALVKRARHENTHVAASIFVNPTQFGPNEDFTSYPRNEQQDLELFQSAGVDLVFMPSVEEIYPADFQTYVEVMQVSQGLEGAHRPGHFRGVATVVSKLFNIIAPHRAYFGQKDAQQVAVIQRMVRDLAIPVEIVVVPTIRAEDGLALSSRNSYLTAEQRTAAPVLYRALTAAQQQYALGVRDPELLRRTMLATLGREPLAQVEYVSVADAESLAELTVPTDAPLLLSMAVRIGKTRLIDNIRLDTIQRLS
jgi:pantoate--beta-alanine ligase